MIQLKVYPTSAKVQEDSIFLDLYDTQPIKLTISIEDIITADATSAFSRTFKVPATRHNALFFKNAFDVNGVTYDITLKKPAEILVDGAEFRQGHIRLQKIYVNGDQDKIDYELLFLGETRDFSSNLSDKPLCQLIMSDLTPVQGDIFERSDLETSWQAFPSTQDANGNPITPSKFNGLADGNLLFPLINFGNTYDDDGNPNESVITVNNSNSSNTFTKSSHPLALNRMKPMIRARRIWDQIFEDAGYTYESNFLDSDRFYQMYVSAFGNSENVGINLDQSNDTQFEAQENQTQPLTGQMEINDVVYSPSGAFSPGSPATYTVPQNNDANRYYIMAGSLAGAAQIEESDYGYEDIVWRVQLYNQTQGTVIKSGNSILGGGVSVFEWDSRNGPDNEVVAGDVLVIQSDINSADYDVCTSAYWECTSAPGSYLVPQDLDCEYKQIDFIKDVLTMFRLVMQPDTNRPKHFIVEPWQDFIGSGDLYDWSSKLVKDKDFVIEPLFDSQPLTMEFSLVEDEDFINQFHFDNYKHQYGWLQFNSGNELLKGNREIKTTEIAPTPINQINHSGVNTNHAHPEWVIPNIYKTNAPDDGGGAFQNEPIKPKTRFLFYNGLQDINQSASGNNKQWYLDTGNAAGKQIRWPLVTPYENWPIDENSLNLNWYNDIHYYNIPTFNPIYNEDGQTLFTEYWSRYIESIYNKFSRKITAYFTLDNTDLQNLTFDDVISINGIYYRPQLISNAEVGNKTQVKVELITLLDYQPIFRDESITGLQLVGVAPTTQNGLGSIDITTNGTPPFSILLNTGQTAGYTDTPGLAPYNFIMSNVAPGTYDLGLTDNLNRTINGPVTVPPFGNTPPASWLLENSQGNISSTATYDAQYSVGQSVDLVGQPGACWTILSQSQVPPINTILGICNPAAGNKYDIRDCDSDLGYILEKDGTNYQLGDVVNYEKFSNPGQIRCGAIVSITSNATATGQLYSQGTYQCGDLVHCYIEE